MEPEKQGEDKFYLRTNPGMKIILRGDCRGILLRSQCI
jgi:hypothetical protein